jgi:hypothetical protein
MTRRLIGLLITLVLGILMVPLAADTSSMAPLRGR